MHIIQQIVNAVLRSACKSCGHHLEPKQTVCPKCGLDKNESQSDTGSRRIFRPRKPRKDD